MAENPKLLDLAPGVQCHHCGYDLRGLAEGQSCPECNEPVWLSAAKRIGELHRHPRWARQARGWLATQLCLSAWLAVPTSVCLWAAVTGQLSARLSSHPDDFLHTMAGVSMFLVYCPPLAPVAAGCAIVLAVRAWGVLGLVREHRVFAALWALSAAIILCCIGTGAPLLGWFAD